jgi:uncharacterized membrane protein
MCDRTTTVRRDDAPVTASKTSEPDRALFSEAVTINRPASELYDFWREQFNLARFMDNVVSIEPAGSNRFRWTVKAPLKREVSWDAEITHEVPGRELTWQSCEGAEIDNSGRIEFIDAGERGTIVRTQIAYDPPAGFVGQMLAKLFGREPRIQARRDLHRFKQLMETGEIATSARNHRLHEERYGPDGQPAGAGA